MERDARVSNGSNGNKNRRSPLSAESVAEHVGIPLADWPGSCHQVAASILANGLVEGVLRYGTWRGPSHPSSVFAGRKFTHHGWIEVRPGRPAARSDPLESSCECGCNKEEHESSGFFRACLVCDCSDWQPEGGEPAVPATIFDPTRWVFEAAEPYLFEGPDREGWYDVAGQAEREANTGLCVRPPHLPGAVDDSVSIRLDAETAHALEDVVAGRGAGPRVKRARGRVALPVWVWAWVANAPVAWFGTRVRPLYEALVAEERLAAFVPIDSQELILGNGWYGADPKKFRAVATGGSGRAPNPGSSSPGSSPPARRPGGANSARRRGRSRRARSG